MEVLVLLANFLAMLLVLIWSSSADTPGKKKISFAFFSYKDRIGASPTPPPAPPARRRR